jgi:hypothetical protein
MTSETPCFLRDSFGVVHEYYTGVGSTICGRRPGWSAADLVPEGITCIACLGAAPGYPYTGDVREFVIAKLVREMQEAEDRKFLEHVDAAFRQNL